MEVADECDVCCLIVPVLRVVQGPSGNKSMILTMSIQTPVINHVRNEEQHTQDIV